MTAWLLKHGAGIRAKLPLPVIDYGQHEHFLYTSVTRHSRGQAAAEAYLGAHGGKTCT